MDFTGTLVGRGNLGTFHIQSKAGDYDAELKSHDNTDIVVVSIVVTPGGNSGWHYHPGPVLVTVKTGTITFYMGDDPSCSAHVHGRLHGTRVLPLGSAIYVYGSGPPHDAVLAGADAGASGVFAHVPMILPAAPWVAFANVG